MAKKYQVVFKFRTGDILELFAEHLHIGKGLNTPYTQLHLDGVAVATLTSGMPNYDTNNNFTVYNASPVPPLYDLMPDSWNKDQTALKLIDEIFVNTTKQEKN